MSQPLKRHKKEESLDKRVALKVAVKDLGNKNDINYKESENEIVMSVRDFHQMLKRKKNFFSIST